MTLEIVLALISLGALIWWLLSPSEKIWRLGQLIPGPKPYPLVGNALDFHIIGPKAFHDIMEAKKKYGRVLRIWLGPQLHVLLCNPDDVQMLLTSQMITKSMVYEVASEWLGTGLLLSTGDLWHKRRKALTPSFHFKVLDDFVPIFNDCADVLVDILSEKCGKGPFDIIGYCSNCALDAISKSSMGVKVDAQRNPKSTYVETLTGMTKFLGEKINYPWLGAEPLYTLTGRKSSEKQRLSILHDLPQKVIQEKKEELNKQNPSDDNSVNEFGMRKRYAFLEKVLELSRKNDPAFQRDQDILDEVVTFMFEGHDTTTSTLASTIWCLGKNPEIQEELYEEVSGILQSNKDGLKMENIQEMKYLERVIKEAMRMFPPVPIIGRKIDKDTVLPSGYTLPAGSEAYTAFVIMHRDPEYFDEPEKFKPDRFLNEQKHPYVYVPFSAGPRNCIGQKFAMASVKTIIAKFVYNYKIKTEADFGIDLEMVLRHLGGVTVSLTKRAKVQ